MVQETLAGTESVSQVARRHDLNTSMVFNWRRRYREQIALESEPTLPGLIPIAVTGSPTSAVSECEPRDDEIVDHAQSSRLEITLAGGHRLSIDGELDAKLLRVVLEMLR